MHETRRNATALWYVAPGRAELREEMLAAPSSNAVLVRTLFSAVSRGTERLIAHGRVPESEYNRMRAPFMTGSFPFPVKYGYAAVGLVEAGPSELIDREVFALHPHQDLFWAPAEALIPLPDGVAPARAVLAANMETALNAVWDAAPGPADRIAVVGGGVVGTLVAWLCGSLAGTHVTLIDVDPSRAGLASALGFAFAEPEAAKGDCDLVVHASGTSAGLATALRLAGDEATVLELSWYGTQDVAIPLGEAFHSRRLRLISSQVGRVALSHRARWTPRARLQAALALLKDTRLDALLMPAIEFRDLPVHMPDIFSDEAGGRCPLVSYGIRQE
jgi:hypothetical protein